MTEFKPSLSTEFDYYRQNADEWLMKSLQFKKGRVLHRFARDCRTFIGDLDDSPEPTSTEVVDISNRHRTLERRFKFISGHCA